MLGPLPKLYRIVVSACALVSFVGLGAWLTLQLSEPELTLVGAGLGAGLGVVAVLLLVDGRDGAAVRNGRLHGPGHHAR